MLGVQPDLNKIIKQFLKLIKINVKYIILSKAEYRFQKKKCTPKKEVFSQGVHTKQCLVKPLCDFSLLVYQNTNKQYIQRLILMPSNKTN